MLRLIGATRNEAKLAELRRLVGDEATVSPLPHDISLGDEKTRRALTAVEDGGSLEEIAAAKAVVWSRLLPGKLLIASDGGLVIPALGESWDPTRTRRFAGESATDVERAEVLLARTADLRGDDRQISWRESVAIAKDGTLLGQWSAESEPGFLATDVDPELVAVGRGFWIESIWECPDLSDRRLASLTPKERKGRGDHWSQLESPLRRFLSIFDQ